MRKKYLFYMVLIFPLCLLSVIVVFFGRTLDKKIIVYLIKSGLINIAVIPAVFCFIMLYISIIGFSKNQYPGDNNIFEIIGKKMKPIYGALGVMLNFIILLIGILLFYLTLNYILLLPELFKNIVVIQTP